MSYLRFFLGLMVCLFALWPAAASAQNAPVKGYNVAVVYYSGANGASGSFVQANGSRWQEFKTGRTAAHASFTETGRDEWSVYMTKADGARIQLDLWTKKVLVNGRELYNVRTSEARRPQAVRPPNNATRCAVENQRCAFSGTANVYYGAQGKWAVRSANGSISCNNATFGDPIHGVVKSCFVVQNRAPVAPRFTTNRVFVHNGARCPAGSRPVSMREAQAQTRALCDKLGQWHIARLNGIGVMMGPGYKCAI
ncbi:MAG: hypothetical protein AB8H79_25690, partial [Myxococcota bacterium]